MVSRSGRPSNPYGFWQRRGSRRLLAPQGSFGRAVAALLVVLWGATPPSAPEAEGDNAAVVGASVDHLVYVSPKLLADGRFEIREESDWTFAGRGPWNGAGPICSFGTRAYKVPGCSAGFGSKSGLLTAGQTLFDLGVLLRI